MAHIQEYFEPGESYTSPPLCRSRFLYNLGNSAAVCPEVAMAHPVLQSPFRQGNHLSQPQWPVPQTPISSISMPAHIPLWEQHFANNNGMAWTGLSTVPLTDESMLTNNNTNNLLYDHNARQNMLDAHVGIERSSWFTNGMINTAPSPSVDVLPSPVSPFGAVNSTESPRPYCDPHTPDQSSGRYFSSSGVAKISSSPGLVPSTPQSITEPKSESSAMRAPLGLSFASVEAPLMDTTNEQSNLRLTKESEYSYGLSQRNSPAAVQWLPPGYIAEVAAPTQGYPNSHSSGLRTDTRPNSFQASLSCSSRQRQVQWSNIPDIPAQSHFQSRFVTPATDAEKSQRAKDDDLLLKMKGDGYTYRDIRKALGRKVAESTLRGRYRSLTKPRKDRLRAPKWTETDIKLLERYVNDEFDRLDETHPSLEMKQKPDKVPWMRIVDLIAKNGGSYKFGAATAKKKWFEITRPAPARSSRRRSQA